MIAFFRALLALAIALPKVIGSGRIDLNEAPWMVKSVSQNIEIPAKGIPGGIYSDLRHSGILTSDFYYRFNDQEYRWVSYENWTYSAEFVVDQDTLNHDFIVLDCKGVDTVSTIMINDQLVGETNNMFVRYSFDVKEFLKLGNNEIRIEFKSPVEHAKNMFQEQAETYVVPPECVAPQFQGECHANHIRKMQSSFSWDWGPAFPSMGIWQDIAIDAHNSAVLRYLYFNPTQNVNGDWDIPIDAIFEIDPVHPIVSGTLKVTFQGKTEEFQGTVLPSVEENKIGALSIVIQRDGVDVDLWWPNGYGDQVLYDLTVEFTDDQSMDTSSITRRVGFRTVEVVQAPVDQGRTFKFRVNGQDLFMKGSNWIPAHVLPELVTPDYTRNLLHSAKEAHMNMLRVWGGGIYESDVFYDLADEYGILIWQDFMFACSMYQATDEVLKSVQQEVRTQVRRLQTHPSIALWAGNNENEAALRGNWYGTDADFQHYKADYVKLYVDTVSSPSNADKSEEDGYIAQNPYSSIYGDTHYYNYNLDTWDYKIYPKTRFASEYGFQSFPSFEVLKPYSEPFDWNFYSDFVNNRQRHPGGNEEIPWQIHLHMELPENELDTRAGFEEFLYQAQVNQAESLRVETEHYRRMMTQYSNQTGEGLTMGTLYWQLNDIWPGASWTTLEHGGKWKISHYFAEQMFRDILISPIRNTDNNQLEVFVISDKLSDFPLSGTIIVEVKRWNNFNETFHMSQAIDAIPAMSVEKVISMDMNEILSNGGCHAGDPSEPGENKRLEYCLITTTLRDTDGNIISQGHVRPYPKDAIGLIVPEIAIQSVTKLGSCQDDYYDTCWSLDIGTDAIALFVWLEAEGLDGRFDANGFLMDSPNRRIQFFCQTPNVSESQVMSSLRVRSYKNSRVVSNQDSNTYDGQRRYHTMQELINHFRK
ncbi:hypothetical protein TCAL_08106 [Tigriopus californicus]|uniref:Beta-mannosidase n=1 Tax=Tigriopus californicus TaxID=6832 RepID=A0A553PPZ5_TIGCA|nr:hypothetical protein TCAL_08106 [Tigriopus californicus]|eukprot:TCALIF_08106-PA protein Name:"Similar to Manba Beta-mannosidase (Rattus norvegicus)" AED:0.07 eAED:0.07 QI:80/0.92/0.86/1/0.85/0.86/15/74/925